MVSRRQKSVALLRTSFLKPCARSCWSTAAESFLSGVAAIAAALVAAAVDELGADAGAAVCTSAAAAGGA
jgi:hypothetical protein